MKHTWGKEHSLTPTEKEWCDNKRKCTRCGITRYTYWTGHRWNAHYKLGHLSLLGPDLLMSGTPPCGPKQDHPCDHPRDYKARGKRQTHCGYCGAIYPTPKEGTSTK